MGKTLSQITEQVKKVIQYNLTVPLKSNDLKGIDIMMNEWSLNKARFKNHKVFSGELIKEIGEVNYHLNAEERHRLFERLLSIIKTECRSYAGEHSSNDLLEFLRINEETFFDNKVSKEFIFPNDCVQAGFIIEPGRKISKSVKFFFNDDTFVRYLQDMISTIMQKDKIKGILCLSIHPLDYLSSSENNYNWRSCHALDGDYCNGNFSYMTDSTTIIAYLKGKDNVKLPHFPKDVSWNDKKWRMLVHINDQNTIMFAGRQYPYFSQELMNDVLGYINSCNSLYNQFGAPGVVHPHWSHICSSKFTTVTPDENETVNFYTRGNYLLLRDQLLPITDVVTAPLEATNFNDLLNSTFYKPYYAVTDKLFNFNETQALNVGHVCSCVKCGDLNLDSDSFLCSKCLNELFGE